jgi:hypothetical protein
MAEPIPAEEQSNYETFRDCLSEPVLKALAAPIEKPKARQKRHAKRSSKGVNTFNAVVKTGPKTNISTTTTGPQASDAEDLGEFIEVQQPVMYTSASLTTT